MASRLTQVGAAVAVITPLVTLLATNGERVLAVLGGLPKVLEAWSSGLPFGVGSFFLALTLSTLLWLWLLPTLPKARDGSRPHLSANVVAVFAAIFVCAGQQWFEAHGNGQMLRAVVVGFIAGLLSPYAGLAIRSGFIKKADAPLPPPVGQ